MSPPESGKPARCDQHPAGPFRTETKTATKPLHLDSEATAPVKPQRTVFTCPECAAACTIDGVDTARHSDACTTGTGSRAVAVADLLWFLDHPTATAPPSSPSTESCTPSASTPRPDPGGSGWPCTATACSARSAAAAGRS